jgi:trimeric autotransporter adhesin
MSRTLRLASAGLVAAAVLAITACGSSTSSGGVAGATGTPGTSAVASAAASASAETSAAPSGLKQALLDFKSENGSTITGGAILTDLGNNQTAVTIGVVAAGVTDPMPASILPGDCTTLSTGGAAGSPAPSGSAAASAAASAAPSAAASGSAEPSASAVPLNPGDVVKLGDLAAGSSNTVVSIGLDGLRSVPYAIVINKSATDTTVVACADVTQ